MQPNFTPLEMLKELVQSPLQRTWPVMLSWKSLTSAVNLHGQPSVARMVHRASLLTVSKALVRSMKTEFKSICCSIYFSLT